MTPNERELRIQTLCLLILTAVAVAANPDAIVRLWTASMPHDQQQAQFVVGEEARTGGWVDYVQGATAVLRAAGHRLGGFDAVIRSEVPLGSGLGWDTHTDNFNQVRRLSQELDSGWATLMSELKERGLLESTTILWISEFGRTPVINTAAGRDHFPAAWSTVLAGAGVKGGQAVGSTAKDGATVAERPVTVADFLATVFTAVGVDPTTENHTWDGRPIQLVKGGRAVEELVK